MAHPHNTRSKASSSEQGQNSFSTQGSPPGADTGSTGIITAIIPIATTANKITTVEAEDPAHHSGSEDSSGLDSGPEDSPAPEDLTNAAEASNPSSHALIVAETDQASLGDLAVAERHQTSIGSVSAPDLESVSGDHHNDKGFRGVFSFLN